MSDLQISLSLPSKRWPVGARFLATVRLLNAGTTPVEVPTTLSPSEFEFRFTSAELQVARVLSGRARRLSRRPDPAPVPRFVMPLAPAATAEYVENLAEYATPPLAPGFYEVTVRWTRGKPGADTSSALTVEVVSPKPLSLVTGTDAAATLPALWSVVSGDGLKLMFREGVRQDPSGGTSYERGDISTSDGLQSALAVAPSDCRGVRWYGWLDAAGLHTGVAQAATVFFNSAPLTLSLNRPRLNPVAWQESDSSATFVLLGDEGEGAATLVRVHVDTGTGIAQQQIRLRTGWPVTRWSVQMNPSDDAPVTCAVLGVTADGDARLVVYEIASDGTAKGRALPAVRAGELQALALAPLTTPGNYACGFVDALFGPSGEPARMTFFRLPLDGGPPLLEVRIAAPVDATGHPAADWTLAPTSAPVPQLIVRLGDQIIGKVLAPGGRGFVLAGDAAGARELRLESVGDAWWAVWIDPTFGLRYARMPDAA